MQWQMERVKCPAASADGPWYSPPRPLDAVSSRSCDGGSSWGVLVINFRRRSWYFRRGNRKRTSGRDIIMTDRRSNYAYIRRVVFVTSLVFLHHPSHGLAPSPTQKWWSRATIHLHSSDFPASSRARRLVVFSRHGQPIQWWPAPTTARPVIMFPWCSRAEPHVHSWFCCIVAYPLYEDGGITGMVWKEGAGSG